MSQAAKDLDKHLRVELDTACKEVLKNIPFLARIVQASAREYGNCSVEEVEKLIRGDQVTDKIVGQAESLNGRNMDLRFDAMCPDGTGKTKVLLNVEVQNKYNPGYDIITRGIFYCALMLVAEDGVEFTGQNYGELKKVYSIWIAVNPSVIEQGCINRYEMNEVHMRGEMTRTRKIYDKLTVVQLNLGEDDDNGILRMLNVLMGRTYSVAEKKQILEEEYGIAMTNEMEGDVEKVCNYSEWVYESGVEQGIQKGIAQGVEQGMIKGEIDAIVKMILNVMKKMKGTPEVAMDFLDIPEEDRPMYVEQLRQRV
ncbi:MAG: hypothetical protein IJ315_09645 [Firmicutes bacterium]|nr:hypothetical protein [Bacillota bacterium]